MYKKKNLIYIIFIFFTLDTNLFSLENKILTKIEKEIVTSIDLENEAKYLLSLNPNIKNLSTKERG